MDCVVALLKLLRERTAVAVQDGHRADLQPCAVAGAYLVHIDNEDAAAPGQPILSVTSGDHALYTPTGLTAVGGRLLVEDDQIHVLAAGSPVVMCSKARLQQLHVPGIAQPQEQYRVVAGYAEGPQSRLLRANVASPDTR